MLLFGRVGFDWVKKELRRLAFSKGSEALVSWKVRKLSTKNDLNGADIEADVCPKGESPMWLSDAMVHHRGQGSAAGRRKTRGQQRY